MRYAGKTILTGTLLPMFLIALCHGCREPFDPPSSKYEDLLVVDGLIADV